MNRSKIIRMLKRLLPDNRGVALIEFALSFPFLFLLLFGGIEITRLLLIQQRLERAGYVVADITTQYTTATNGALAGEINVTEMRSNVFPQLTRLMGTYSAARDQAVIVTSIRKTGGRTRVMWQIASSADTLSGCDKQLPPVCVISIVNGVAPGGITQAVAGKDVAFPAEESAILASLPNNSNMIVSEVFYHYRPILQTLLQSTGEAGGHGFAGFRFYLKERNYVKRTYFAPRSGDLLTLPPTFP